VATAAKKRRGFFGSRFDGRPLHTVNAKNIDYYVIETNVGCKYVSGKKFALLKSQNS